jgi:beta-galactosidase
MVIDEVKIFDKAVSMDVLKNETAGAVLSLDFETDTKAKDEDFFAVGLGGRTYGIIWPDRKIQPEIYQIKKSGQPVKIDAVDIKNGLVEITNRHHFKNLNELDGMWELTVNGDTIQRGFFQVDCAPGETVTDTIPFRMPKIEADSECLLTVAFLLKENTKWATAGHEIAWEQMPVPAEIYVEEKVLEQGKVAVRENNETIVVSGKNFRIRWIKNQGNSPRCSLMKRNTWRTALNLMFGGRLLPTTSIRGEATCLNREK